MAEKKNQEANQAPEQDLSQILKVRREKLKTLQEADPMNGRISEESPFGKALLGQRVGEEVVVEAPAGNLRYQILKIER